MPKNTISVVLERVFGLVSTRIRNAADTVDLEMDASGRIGVNVQSAALPTGAATSAKQDTQITHLATIAGDTTSLDAKVTACNTGAVVISGALPVGANTIGNVKRVDASGNVAPAMDAAARRGYFTHTDGTNSMPTGDAPARPVHHVWVPNRPTSAGAAARLISMGSVPATWADTDSAAQAQSADYDFWLTDLDIVSGTDPTAEVAIQPIPVSIFVMTTGGAYYQMLFGEIPGNTHFSFRTPIKIEKSAAWKIRMRLGGATALTTYVVMNGFETA